MKKTHSTIKETIVSLLFLFVGVTFYILFMENGDKQAGSVYGIIGAAFFIGYIILNVFFERTRRYKASKDGKSGKVIIVKDAILSDGIPFGILAIIGRTLYDCRLRLAQIDWSKTYDKWAFLYFVIFLVIGTVMGIAIQVYGKARTEK